MTHREPTRGRTRTASSKGKASARTPAVNAAMLAAEHIARDLMDTLGPSAAAWARSGSAPFLDEDVGLPYARATVFTLGEAIAFSVWVDRTLAPRRVDHPILCASFEGELGLLREAVEGRVRLRAYGPLDQERIGGYGGAPTFEEDGSGSAWLSTYRPSDDVFNVSGAVAQFAEFFRRESPRLEALCGGAAVAVQPHAAERGGGSLARLEGLVGELAVLLLPGWESAKWVGPTNAVHDIETTHWFVEVKTTVGEDRAPVLSRQQITCGGDERFFFALVDMPVEALRLLAGRGTGLPAPDVFLVQQREEIQRYLAPTRITVDDALLRKLSAAVRMCSDIKWHRLRVPDGWMELLSAIEKHGDLVEFRQRCPSVWFTPCAPPTP
jgi:hypothetical protein